MNKSQNINKKYSCTFISPLLYPLILPFFRSESRYFKMYRTEVGSGSSVGIATDYGLDVSGLNPGGNEIFRTSRPALGRTQPPVKRVPGLSRG